VRKRFLRVVGIFDVPTPPYRCLLFPDSDLLLLSAVPVMSDGIQ
jgi:hypothetical protein